MCGWAALRNRLSSRGLTVATKTRSQLEKDVGAMLKLIFFTMEELAVMDPVQAAHPYTLEAHRTRLMRKIWTVFKETMNYDPRGTTE